MSKMVAGRSEKIINTFWYFAQQNLPHVIQFKMARLSTDLNSYNVLLKVFLFQLLQL